jgi:hypothetical protein
MGRPKRTLAANDLHARREWLGNFSYRLELMLRAKADDVGAIWHVNTIDDELFNRIDGSWLNREEQFSEIVRARLANVK